MIALLKYLKLDDFQQATLSKWLESLPDHRVIDEEADSCMSQHPFNVTCYGSGVGDTLIVWTNIGDEEYSIHLEYDDDGIIIGVVE